jgi:DoxX-like family/Uncharacterized conserved protein (COG2071)
VILDISDLFDIATARIAPWFVAAVWLVHGLYNKLAGGSPRHLAIVQSVPGLHGRRGRSALTAVGVFEVGIALWVLSGWRPVPCAATETAALLAMNALELTFARHLLLWPAGLVPLNVVFLSLAWYAAGAPHHAIATAAAGGAVAVAPAILARLRRHPIPIEARLEDCLTLTFALPPEVLRPLLPPGLELETSHGYGFVAIALVQTRSLRPAGLGPALGQDFFLAGYRIFTTFTSGDGRTARGLRILRSDADRLRMVVGGNLLTHYRYHRCRATSARTGDRLDVSVRTPDGCADIDLSVDLSRAALPIGSPFASIREARRFAGPLMYTFDYEPESDAIVSIEALRTNWRPVPVAVDSLRLTFFDQADFGGCRPVLAAAFHVSAIPYRWQRGVMHPLRARRAEAAS